MGIGVLPQRLLVPNITDEVLGRELAQSRCCLKTDTAPIKSCVLSFMFGKNPKGTGMLFLITFKRETLSLDWSPLTMSGHLITRQLKVCFLLFTWMNTVKLFNSSTPPRCENHHRTLLRNDFTGNNLFLHLFSHDRWNQEDGWSANDSEEEVPRLENTCVLCRYPGH